MGAAWDTRFAGFSRTVLEVVVGVARADANFLVMLKTSGVYVRLDVHGQRETDIDGDWRNTANQHYTAHERD